MREWKMRKQAAWVELENAGVEYAGAITHGKLSEENQ